MRNIVVVYLLSNLNRSYTNYNNSIYTFRTNRNLCAGLNDLQLIFKNVRRNEKVYTKCKSEKITEADSAPRNRS